ncbi:MAG: hypothetical protein U9R60_14360 [Bacteroidota bacterium]|nr:hypothetical protein [Bacteroidota bacterium]
MSKKDLTFAISHMEQEKNEYCSYSNIIRGNEVYVRGGINSFNPGATMALYVVDDQTTSCLDWIHPCDIKSTGVLKDGNAAIYGAGGGNGVVLIELKK